MKLRRITALALAACLLTGCTRPRVTTPSAPRSAGHGVSSPFHRSAPIYLPGATQPRSVSYQVFNGIAYRHGDIIMGPVETLHQRFASPRMFYGSAKGAVAPHEGLLWPGGVVPFEIHATLDQQDREDIAWAVDQLNRKTVLTLRPRRGTDRDYLVFEDDGTCSSSIGRVGGAQSVFVGDCGGPTVIHEVMHAVGFEHEQCRPDRDQFVEVRFENVYPGMEGNFERVDDALTFSPYDYASLMHYGAHDFSRNGEPTIVSRQRGQRLGGEALTDLDITEINAVYGDEPPTAPTLPPTPGVPPITIQLPGGGSLGWPSLPHTGGDFPPFQLPHWAPNWSSPRSHAPIPVLNLPSVR